MLLLSSNSNNLVRGTLISFAFMSSYIISLKPLSGLFCSILELIWSKSMEVALSSPRGKMLSCNNPLVLKRRDSMLLRLKYMVLSSWIFRYCLKLCSILRRICLHCPSSLFRDSKLSSDFRMASSLIRCAFIT